MPFFGRIYIISSSHELVPAKRLIVSPRVIPTKPRIDQKDSRPGNLTGYESGTRASTARGRIVPKQPAGYAALLRLVKETLLFGQQKVEQAKVETYWQTGRHIHEHILHHKGRADYRTQVIQKLAADLEVSDRLLYQTHQFYQAFQISHGRAKSLPSDLSWTHFRTLSRVADDKTRTDLIDRAVRGKWSAELLEEKIKVEAPAGRSSVSANGKPHAAEGIPKLIPKLGALYTYRLVKEEGDVQGDDFLRVDLGFEIRKWLRKDETKGLRENQIIESFRAEDGEYSFRKSERKEDSLYTYKARVLRVIDGDTLFCLIDFGFKTEQRHYLRLRGIDCPELATPEGKKAKAFVVKALEKVPEIIMTSTRKDATDKYGRYVADLHIPLKDGKTEFLNQRLLDEGLAVKL